MVRFHSEPPFFLKICIHALVAQLDRVFGYEPKGQGFESLRAHHYYREMAQLGRALGLGPRGCRFKSCFPDHLDYKPLKLKGFIILLIIYPLKFPWSQTLRVYLLVDLIVFKMLIALSSSLGIK